MTQPSRMPPLAPPVSRTHVADPARLFPDHAVHASEWYDDSEDDDFDVDYEG